MGAGIELLTGQLRIGPEYHKYRDPYEFSCSFVRIGDAGYFIGASSKFRANLVGERAAIRSILRQLGVRTAYWSDIVDGVEIWKGHPV